MHTWLKRAVAGLLSAVTLLGGGLLTAGTANADEIRMPDIGKTITSLTTSAATTYPRELVNGDFEYPSMKSLQHYFTGIDRNRSQWISNGQGGDLAKWSDIPGGLDTTRFGWSSTQTQGAMSEQRANAVELQKATGETTQMGELCASQKGTAIYQDIATTPGTLYRIELDHASRYRIHLDQMQVMVGAPGHEQPVEMTRTSSNKYGDKIGEKSTTIATHSTNPFGNQSSKDDFSHYVGYYTIPAGQSVTRFTFRQVSGVNTTSGNLLDNIVFTQAYKLSYDKNSDEATGQTPNGTATVKPAKTSATGGVKNIADTNASLPDHLVNGDFEYLPDGGWKTVDAPSYMTNAYTSVDPNNGQYMRNAKHSDADLASWADWPGFDQSKFAWKSDQKGGHDQGGLKDRAEAVELQQDSMDGNTYAEMVASEPGRTIYQNLATIPGTLYKIRLKHTSLCKDNVDQMQVVINGTPIEMTRVAANGKAGDKVGEKSKTIGTRVTNENRWHHSDQWETYEGYYVIPDGQTTTRFGFKAVNYLDPTKGNLLDDVTFTRSYKLTYDKNASDATGKVPSNQRGKENAVEPAESKTTGNVKTVADNTSNLPDHLVNGTFDYRGNEIINENQRVYGQHDTTYLAIISAKTGVIGNPLHSKLDNWDSGKFGWKSNDDTAGADTVEVQRRNHTPYPTNAGNVWGEIAAAKRGKYIYQDIATTPGVVYKWSLKHASRNADQDDSMQVMIGEPGAEAVQEATRTTSNGTDKVGEKSTTITTHGTAQDGRWETYTGTYIATGTVTRFTFKSVSSSNNVNGNILDDLSFTKAYRLGYDGNGGTGQVPSRTEVGKTETAASKTNGTVRPAADKNTEPESGAIADDRRVLTDTTIEQDDGTAQRTITRSDGSVRVETIADTGAVSGCQVYYPAGTRITLATAKADSDCWDSSQIGKTNRTFYGWSANTDANDRDVPVGDTMDRNTLNANVRTEIVMPARAKTVYALWAINPTLSYNVNAPAGSNAPGTPASQTVPYNTAAADKSGWAAGDTGKIPGYRFDGWYTAPNGGNKYDFNTPLTGNVTVYAHWVGNGYTVRFAGNGATGGNTAAQSGHTGDELTTNANGFTRDGYTFVRWDTAEDGSGTAYGEGKNGVSQYVMKPAGNDLYAIWKANPATIQYRNDWPNTTGSTPDTTGVTGQDVTIAQNGFTRPGYTFTGWARDRRTNPSLQPGGRYTLTPGTTTLWAQWKADPAHLIYNANTGSTSQTRRTDGVVDQTLTVIANPFTRTGYTFTGWNTQADGRGKAYTAGNGFRLVADPKSNPVNTSVLYAQWRINRVTLKFNPNGGTGGYPDITVDAFTTVTIPADAKEPKVQRPGFRFTGWAMKPTPGAGDTILSPGKGTVSMPDRGSITVYAQWAPAMTTLPFTGGNAQVPTIWLYAGFALMLIALGVMMPMLRMRMAATKRTGKHMPITGGKHAK